MKNNKVCIIIMLVTLFFSSTVLAQAGAMSDNALIFGFKVSAGGRYDDIRMCVATPAGVKGGIAMDISFFTEIGLSDKMSLTVDIPVMRPILFAAAFKMLQFEPSVTLNFRKVSDGKVDFVAGPSLGVILHYGPDYNSEQSGEGRGSSFFAMGPRIGGYLGLDFKRPGEAFNFQLGISPYIAPLFGIKDPDNHKGVVAGGYIDGLFRFSTSGR